MATTIISTNSVGTGPRFTYAANGDQLIILDGVTLGATFGDALAGTDLDDITLTVLGSIAGSTGLSFSGEDAVITIAKGGSFVSSDSAAGNAAVFLDGALATLTNDGTFLAPTSIGVLSLGGNEIVNAGSMLASSPVFMGLFGGAGDSFTNSGSVVANSYSDDTRNERYNNGVFTEGQNTLINNLATGTIMAVSTEGAGVRFGSKAGGSQLLNHGEITSVQDFGVNLGTVYSGEATIRVVNRGTISGLDGAYNGSVNADTVLNRGVMQGDVIMGDGGDLFDNRGGFVDGDWFGGDGNDAYLGRSNTVVAGEINGGAGNDSLKGGANDDAFRGGAGKDRIFGFNGDDTIHGDGGNDILSGGEGQDYLSGGAGNDVMSGGAGDDTLIGGNGADTLNGNDGNDRLEGGAGRDILRGGAGQDTFVFLSTSDSPASAKRDRLLDFTRREDLIDLSQIDANTTSSGNQSFTLIGADAFSGTAGELRYVASNGLVLGDVDGDGNADFSIFIATRPAVLTTADFLL